MKIIYDQKVIDRFWSKIIFPEDIENDCWKFNRYHDKDGYPIFSIKLKNIKAHRFMYMIHHQDENIDSLFVCHSCDYRGCVNPKHLFVDTHQGNMDDMVMKNRQSKGSDHYFSKLTEDDIKQILNDINIGVLKSVKDIQNYYQLSECSVRYILNGKSRKHVTKDYDLVKINKMIKQRKDILDVESVIKIKKLLKNGETHQNIIQMFNINPKTIYQIKNNLSYTGKEYEI